LFATGGKTGGFYALAAANGVRLWSYPTTGGTVAAMITVAGTVLGADTKGTVCAHLTRLTGRLRRRRRVVLAWTI
jgi:outer membrane protein assembly factor BamB